MRSKINITVLVAPLDWGLGHCTRCIPLIEYFQQSGCTVILAAEGAQAKLLQQEFPLLTVLPLQGYRIRYSKSKRWFAAKILWQLPKLLQSIKNEQIWLNRVVDEHKIDIVISDNRYGLHHPSIRSIIITHQLQVQTPFLWTEKIVQRRLFKFINQFSACWVPDAAGNFNLSGKLAHPHLMPAIPVVYIGPLSRMIKANDHTLPKDVLILLSGPEPQRTLLETIILSQVHSAEEKITLVRGLPLTTEHFNVVGVKVINHLPAAALNDAINKAELVICRSGYSTIMDLCKLMKKSILIPTPGQTEQEYLADYLSKKSWCLYFKQNEFNLMEAIKTSKLTPYYFPAIEMETYKKAIDDLLYKTLKS